MKKKAFILYQKYLTEDGSKLTIGGIQTYIYSLSQLLIKQGFEVNIYQCAQINFIKEKDGMVIHGIDVSKEKKQKNTKKKLFNECMKSFNNERDTLIFACESMIVKNHIKDSIAIQHGINWDVKSHEKFSSLINRWFLFRKALTANKIIKRIHYVNKLICVDYNFVNWYRSQVAYEDLDLQVIPNYSEIPNVSKMETPELKLIFARRFAERRGSRLFVNSIIPILNKYENLKVSIAGEGPDSKWMKHKLKQYKQVEFMTYKPEDSLKIHSNHDIAIVPSLGSEGTSLSLLEAMAAKCAVVATDVGGMTNIVIDGYNGLLISPKEELLRSSIEKLLLNETFRNQLSEKAYDTVSKAFSKSIWEKKWIKIINN